jgi:hypothetical protein
MHVFRGHVDDCRYEATLDEPLVDKATGVKVYVHSVCPYHASSVETARALLLLVKPSITAIGIDNTNREGLEDVLARRKALTKDKEHVMRIVDGYYHVCTGGAYLFLLCCLERCAVTGQARQTCP